MALVSASPDLTTDIEKEKAAKNATPPVTPPATPLVPPQPAPPPPAGATYTPEKIALDPTTDTVEGRINSIVNKNSPLMQEAQQAGVASLAPRGLVNSSIAVGAGQKAVLDTAQVIASQDAKAALDTKASNQKAANEAAALGATGTQHLTEIGATGEVQSKLQAEQGEINKSLQTADAASRVDLLNRQAKVDAQLQQMKADQASKLQAEQGQIQQQLLTAEGAQKAALLDRQGQIDTALQELRGSQTQSIAQLQADNQVKLQTLSGDQALKSIQLENQYRTLLQTSQNASQMYMAYSAALGQIMSNDQMTPENKQIQVNELLTTLNNGLSMVGAFGNVNLDDFFSKGGAGGTAGTKT